MSTLAAQQAALLARLFDPKSAGAIPPAAPNLGATGARGLKAYQSNGHGLAERALKAAFPVLTQLLGEDSLCGLARAFWHAAPPRRGDLAQWGAALADFVRASEQLADAPYLADVVASEWALHCCSGAPNQSAEPASFALMMRHAPCDLVLRLAPGCAVIPSLWPVASILRAHLAQAPGLAEVGQRLRAGVAEAALVWREGFRARVREAIAGEADFVAALLRECSLAEALRQSAGLDFNAWLPMAVETQLLLGVAVLPASGRSDLALQP